VNTGLNRAEVVTSTKKNKYITSTHTYSLDFHVYNLTMCSTDYYTYKRSVYMYRNLEVANVKPRIVYNRAK